MVRSQTPAASLIATLAAVVLFVFTDALWSTLRFLGRERGVAAAASSLAFYAATAAGTLLLLRARNAIARHVALNVTIAAVTTSLITRRLTSSGFDAETARIFVREGGFAGDAVVSFLHLYVAPMLLGFLAGCALYVAANHLWPRVRTRLALLPFAVGTLLLVSPDVTFDVAPAPLRVPALLLRELTRRDPPRDVAPAPFATRSVRHIVLIVDESVRGDHLSINGYARATTPFLASVADDYANFGVASSAANCSASSNLLLRTAADPSMLPDRNGLLSRLPDLFSYARRAGYRTVLIDGQSRAGDAPNGISRDELNALDAFIPLRDAMDSRASWETDDLVATELNRELESHRPSFIYVNKAGAHFHYARRYPPGEAAFRPAVESGTPLRDAQLVTNAYDNAVRWSVDRFFARVLPVIARANAFAIYTSDHGESLASPVYAHCVASQPPAEQGRVPLLVLSSNEELNATFRAAAARNRGRASHYQIAPTLLQLMGFPSARATLLDDAEEQRFFSGDVEGRGPYSWNAVR